MHVLVIGAGLLGTTTAWFLRQHGLDVTVVDRREGPGLETSWGNGGYQQTGYPEPWNIPGIAKMLLPAWKASWGDPPLDAAMLVRTKALPSLVGWGLSFLKHATPAAYHRALLANRRLAHFSQKTLTALDEELKLDCALNKRGGLWIFRDQASLDQYAGQVEKMREHGSVFDILDRSGVLEKEKSLLPIGEKIIGGLHFPGEICADPHRFCAGLAQAASDAGVEFLYQQEVHGVSTGSGPVSIQTNHGELTTDKLVIAAGHKSPQLARGLGIRLPIRPAKGYSISIPMEGWEDQPSHMIGDMSLHAGTSPMGDFLRVAGTAEFAGDDLSISQNRIDSLLRLLEQIFPEFAANMDRENLQPWAGLRPLSVDGMAFMGESGIENIYLNTGHGGLGWTQSAGSGKAIADLIANKAGALDLSAFSIKRP